MSSDILRDAFLKVLAQPADLHEEDDLDALNFDPPPPIDPQRIGNIPNMKSLLEAGALLEDLEHNIDLLQGRETVARRARRLDYLKSANGAKRCEHMKLDGSACGSPAVRGENYCYFHKQAHAPEAELPVIEDQESLQVAYTRLAQQLVGDKISAPRARVLLQILQSAGKNLADDLA